MRDFTKNLESLGDIQGKYPPGTLVLRAQYVYMLQDQFRDLELDYSKISEMYVAEMEKAAKLESVNAENRKLKRALYKACANWARSERYTEATWHGDEHREELWASVQAKCLKRADEAK